MGGIWILVLGTSFCWLYLLPAFTPVKVNFIVPLVFPLLLGMAGGVFHFCQTQKKQSGTNGQISLNDFTGAVGTTFVFTFFLLLIQGIATPLIYTVLSRIHEVKWLNYTVYPVVNFFGLNTSISEGVLYIPTFKSLLAFPGLLEKLNLYLVFYIFTGGGLVILVMAPCFRNFAKFLGIIISYAWLRYLFMVFVYAQTGRTEIYWNPEISVISFLPLALFLFWLVPIGHSFVFPCSLRACMTLSGKQHITAAALFFVSVFCLTGACLFHDPGEKKQGRILINENHSNWEWSTRPFDTTWYGRKSTYNYFCMADYFNHYYKVDHNMDKALSSDILSDFDILIIKTPTEPYTSEEIESIVDFVEKGGGLWLVGDHTNVFGMSYYINFIAKKFNLFFHYDSTYDLKTGRLSVYKPPGILAHPIVRNMPPFLFATSCTLDAPFTAEDVMTGYGLRTRLLSYSGRSFFHQEPTTDYEFGLFLQAAAVKYGRGRVAAFTDSTCFSNFYMFIPGKPELALGTMEWLNRENRFGYVKLILILVCILSIFPLIMIYRKSDPPEQNKFICKGICVSLCSLGAGLFLFTGLNQLNFPAPRPHTDYKSMAFEAGHSNMALPVKKLVDKEPNNFHTFYVWTQRLKYFPEITEHLEDAVKNDVVVLTYPHKNFSSQEEHLLRQYVQKGGKLLVLDDLENTHSTSSQILKSFDMEIVFDESGQLDHQKKQTFHDIYYADTGRKLFTAKNTGFVKGGQTILGTKNNKACFAVKKIGKGGIGVMSNACVFTNKFMGGTQIVPDKRQKQIYMTEFLIIKTMEGLNQ
ncbi:MAG: hypothetical protein U9P10_15900 [Thermodesulfobacteriota bacterium]|nr:hypothetical protein [Thermodesulfobacteriota bacterium]